MKNNSFGKILLKLFLFILFLLAFSIFIIKIAGLLNLKSIGNSINDLSLVLLELYIVIFTLGISALGIFGYNGIQERIIQIVEKRMEKLEKDLELKIELKIEQKIKSQFKSFEHFDKYLKSYENQIAITKGFALTEEKETKNKEGSNKNVFV